MCSCGIKHSNVDEESFAACNEKLSEYVPFRARLSGTSDYDSEYLVSLLTKWVSTRPRIIVTGLEMEVANNELNCTTVLLDFEKDCLADNEPSRSGINVATVLAIAAPLVGIICGTITIVLIIVTIWRNCGKWESYYIEHVYIEEGNQMSDGECSISHMYVFTSNHCPGCCKKNNYKPKTNQGA